MWTTTGTSTCTCATLMVRICCTSTTAAASSSTRRRCEVLRHPGATTMAAFADYDRDGDPDIYLLNNRVFSTAEENPKIKLRMVNGKPTVHPDFREEYFLLAGRLQEAGQRDILLRNRGDGSFEDVTDVAGIQGYDMGLSATWWDYNDDGWLDLYVGNDLKSPDHLYRNNGDGSFTDVLSEVVPHTPWFSMGADTADLNGDGILDLLIADMSSTTHYKQKTTMGEMGNSAWFLTMGKPRQFMRNACFLSTGIDRTMEVASLLGLDSTDWTWSVKFGDYDNDGRIDVFITNGVARNLNDSDVQNEFKRLMREGKTEEARNQILSIPPLKEKNIALRNLGDLKFQNVSQAWGLDHHGVSQGASAVDIDRDGDLDLIVNNMNEPLGVYRNDSPAGRRVLIQLIGSRSNKNGIGAKITLESSSGRQVRQLTLARGYMTADEPLVHFGVGNDQTIDLLQIDWPSGTVQTFHDLVPDRMYTVTEPAGEVGPTSPVLRDRPVGQFTDVTGDVGLRHAHQETDFDDFQREPLLPNKLSQLGPGVAWGDVNQDGRFDCYVGGAAGQAGAMFVQTAAGKFKRVSGGPWQSHERSEDMGVVFLDADSDGDQDLYVVSGGVEYDAGDPALQDRLYLNDGRGNFRDATAEALPEMQDSGSCAVACDFDRDGDLDLFVGSRVIPGRWPLAPRSHLLRNEGGRFRDVTEELAPELEQIGLVTGAVWSDCNSDGWSDFLLSIEWGPITLFLNKEGRLSNHTEAAGLSADDGWWNSIAAGDIDNDGDMDYVAMNIGLNTKYHASKDKPAQLFVRNFDGNGRLDLVEAEWEGDTCFPIRGRSCSSQAIPFIKDKFASYHDFAIAALEDIYTPEALDQSLRLEAHRLESVLLVNHGDATFEIRDLPRFAQASPGFGVVIRDLNADGNADIYVVQNFMQPQPETGQMDGGMSLLLWGDGQGQFQPVMPSESGLVVTGQGMALTTVDWNNDAWPDLLLSTNDGPARAYANRPLRGRQAFKLQLLGSPGNLAGIGAKVTLVTKSGRLMTREVDGGSGYLSQSSGELFFGIPAGDAVDNLRVTWPDGMTQICEPEPADNSIKITRQEAHLAP